MADRMQTSSLPGAESTVTSLLTGIVNDAQELIKQQLMLFRHELKDDVNRAREALPSLGLGVSLLVAAVLFLGMTAALLLNWAVGDAHLPLWSCFLIVTILFGVVGGALLYFAKKTLE